MTSPEPRPEDALMRVVTDSDTWNLTLDVLKEIVEKADVDALEDVPAPGLLTGLLRSGAKIRNWLFARKFYRFLSEMDEIPASEREEFRQKMEADRKLRDRVATNLLLCLEGLTDLEKTELLAVLFQAYVAGRLSVDELSHLCSVVDRAHLGDLRSLSEHRRDVPDDVAYRLVGEGLMMARGMSAGEFAPTIPTFEVTPLGTKMIQTCGRQLRNR